MSFHPAQLNIARSRYPVDAPGTADFFAEAARVGVLADTAPEPTP